MNFAKRDRDVIDAALLSSHEAQRLVFRIPHEQVRPTSALVGQFVTAPAIAGDDHMDYIESVWADGNTSGCVVLVRVPRHNGLQSLPSPIVVEIDMAGWLLEPYSPRR